MNILHCLKRAVMTTALVMPGVLVAQVTLDTFNNWSPSSSYAAWAPDASPAFESGADSWKVTATNFGGAYRYLGGPGTIPSIAAMQSLVLDVTVDAQSNGPAGIGFLVLVEDRDGTVNTYSRFGVREGTHQIKWSLASPASTSTPGSTPGLDFSDIKSINIQIDPGGPNSYTVRFNDLKAMADASAPAG